MRAYYKALVVTVITMLPLALDARTLHFDELNIFPGLIIMLIAFLGLLILGFLDRQNI
ncbi:MAG: hypothetical protein KDC49_10375 [Saprospiraceae bacterium]|nr:hypothetical protein [Saprospiraceae bacterium]